MSRPPPRHVTWLVPTADTVKMNCRCSYNLYICDVNYYIGENDEIFQHLVKILMEMRYCQFDGSWACTARKRTRGPCLGLKARHEARRVTTH